MAVGAQRKNIMLQFLLETTAITLTGGVIGIALGVIGSKILAALMKMPTTLSWESIVLGVIFSSAVGLVAGLQPARRAASLQPVEALRS
jgi:putative ABC transport system permease protein